MAVASMRDKIATLVASRTALLQSLAGLADQGVGPSIGGNDANFVMIPILSRDGSGKPDNVRSNKVYRALAEENGVVVRFRGNEPGCEGCVRITIGTEKENETVIRKLGEVLQQI